VFLLIRSLIDISSERRSSNVSAGCFPLPIKENVVRAVVSIAEHEEDANVLRWPAVEILAEIRKWTRMFLEAMLNHSKLALILMNYSTSRCPTFIRIGGYSSTSPNPC
jgi:hypothetical protein